MAELTNATLTKALVKANAGWSAGLNPITGLDAPARKRLLGVVVDRKEVAKVVKLAAAAMAPSAAAAAAPAAAPPAVDWRNVGGQSYVTAVKDQKDCGSCVSFCSCGSLESMAAIRNHVTIDLSEADLHFCSAHGANCGGWWPSSALERAADAGSPGRRVLPVRVRLRRRRQPVVPFVRRPRPSGSGRSRARRCSQR